METIKTNKGIPFTVSSDGIPKFDTSPAGYYDVPNEWGFITGDIEAQLDLQQALNNKADKSEIPSLDGYATKQYVDSGLAQEVTARNLAIANYHDDTKADKSTTYTKSEADTAISSHHDSTKADKSTTYTKTEVDSAISNHHDLTKQDSISDLDTIRQGAGLGATAVQPAAISDMATQTWVGQQDYANNTRVNEVEDEIPDVIDNVTSTSETDALSAKQGKNLNDRINNISTRGRFLSLWDCTTGLPLTNPSGYPYEYHTGDFFIVNKTRATNYIPNGSSYTGVASTTVYTGEIKVNDTIFYDGDEWMVFDTPAGSGSGNVQDVYVNNTSVLSGGIAYVVVPTDLADLNEDTTHRVVTDTEKSTWNAKGTYTKPSTGIPKTDLASGVQSSLDKADTALQAHQSLSDYRTASAQDTIDSGKMSKDTTATEGNIAVFDANGNAVDSDKPISAVLPVLTGTTAPTSSTVAEVGQIYRDTVKNIFYICVGVNEDAYSWNALLLGLPRKDSRYVNGIRIHSGYDNGTYIMPIAIGLSAEIGQYDVYGIAIGCNATAESGIAIGSSNTGRTKALGQYSIAIGNGMYNDSVVANGKGAIQLGMGTNNNAWTFQVYSYQLLDETTGLIPYARTNDVAQTVDSVLVAGRRYLLGTQSTLSLTLPTTAELGQQIEVVFSSGATACTLTCSLTGFDFVPKANTTNKIVFELIHKADTSVTGDEDVWSVEVKEG